MTVGGGSGQFALLSGLRDRADLDITAVVSMADSGGSTGRLRDEFGILPPGDTLKCILALSPHREVIRSIFLRKFTGSSRLKGHNAGNMLLTMISRYTGSFAEGVQAFAETLDARGRILPVTTDRATLVAELTDNTRIYGETAIDIPRGTQREKIRDVFLVPHHGDEIHVYPPVIQEIEKADFIIIGPGDLFTSIFPSLIVPGVKHSIQKARAKVIYVINIMTKYGETHQYTGMEFIRQLESHIGRQVDGVVYNSKEPDSALMKKYKKQKSDFVRIDSNKKKIGERRIYASNLLDTSGGIVRHDSEKLARIIESAIEDLFASSPARGNGAGKLK